MGTRPHWTYNYQIWCEGSRRRHNHWWQILSRSVQGFSVCGGPKMGVSHWLELSPLQQVSTTVLPVIKIFWKYFANTWVFYFTHNQVWKWNKIVSAAEIRLKFMKRLSSTVNCIAGAFHLKWSDTNSACNDHHTQTFPEHSKNNIILFSL